MSTLRHFKNISANKMKDLKTKWMKRKSFSKMQWGLECTMIGEIVE